MASRVLVTLESGAVAAVLASLLKDNCCKFVVVQSSVVVPVVVVEELLQVLVLDNDADLRDGTREGGEVDLARVGKVEELEGANQELLLGLVGAALLLKLVLQLLLEPGRQRALTADDS